jgi:hypothetical protein
VPAGFRLVRAVAARTYTVLIYRGPIAAVVTEQSLAADHLGTTSSLALLETRRAQG